MLGAIIGDIVGSTFVKNPVSSMDFKLFSPESHFTDNTVLTLSVAKGLLEVLHQYGEEPLLEDVEKVVTANMKKMAEKYEYIGFPLNFQRWLKKDQQPYESKNNTAAKRVSPVAYFAEEEFQVTELAEVVSAITHETQEALEGADVLAHLIYLARKGFTKADLYDYSIQVYPPMSENIAEYRQFNHFTRAAEATVPLAIFAFMISESFRDTLKTAVYLGGDTTAITSMAGALAGAYYGVPDVIADQVWQYLPKDLTDIIKEWDEEFTKKRISSPYRVITKYLMLFKEISNPIGHNYEKLGLTSNLDSLIRSFTNEMIEFMNVNNLLPKFRNWTLTKKHLDITQEEMLLFEMYKDLRVNRFTKGYLRKKIKSGELLNKLKKLKNMESEHGPIVYLSYEYGNYFEGNSKYEFVVKENGEAVFSRFEKGIKVDEVTINKEDTQGFVEELIDLEMEDWLPNYYNTDVVDGVQWTVKSTRIHEHYVLSTGSNCYPANWEKFESLIRILQRRFPDFSKKVTYYQVEVPGFEQLYDYRFKGHVAPNERVCVPFGPHDTLKVGRVVAERDFYLDDVPFPLEKMKWIAGVLKDEQDEV